jgi:hypothetical protein
MSTNVASRWSRGLALALLGLSMGMVAFSIGSLVMPGADALPDRPAVITVLIAACVMLSYPLVGTLVVIRRPGNPIGWLFVVLGFGFTIGFFTTEYLGRALISGWALPGVVLVAWIGSWSFVLDMGIAFAWIPLLFPTGRLPGPRWRIVALALTLTMGAGVAAVALRPGTLDETYDQLQNPFAAPGIAGVLEAIDAISFPAIALLGLLCIASLFVRFRRGSSVERQQIKWLLLATTSFLVTLVIAFATLLQAIFMIALIAAAGIPVAAGIAIMRYRLWDIDRLVSRSIGWAVVTGILAAVFGALVVILQAVLASVTDENTLAVAASTLVAFALFQPLRRRVQRAVDRRFDRARYDAERVVGTFSERLRNQIDLGSLEDEIARVAHETVRPSSTSVWLRNVRNDSPTPLS